jgi:hypothetical protein
MTLDPIRRLKTLGRDVAEMPLSHIPSREKVCFICVNCFKSYRGNMGVGPINDSVQFAKVMKYLDFEIFILQTPHARNFLPIFDKFLENTSKQLVFYYAGQSLKDLDEMDQIDEYHFIFDDGPVAQADVVKHIVEKKNKDSILYMITHRAPKNSIFSIGEGVVEEINLPPQCLSITTVRDPRTPLDVTMTNANEEGAFTYELCKCLKEIRDCTPEMLDSALKKTIAEYGHILTIGTSTPELLNSPMFVKEFD